MTEAIAADGRLTDWQERVREAAAAKTLLRIVGAGSKDFYGEPPIGERFETSAYSGVIDYDPAELVVTARCGTTLAELERTLAGGRQMLAFEPPGFGPAASPARAVAASANASGGLSAAGAAASGSDKHGPATRPGTLGGVIAAGLAGPRRPWGGAVRDSVLGVRIIDGQGEDLSFGGRVMKNVAGFDVSRVIAGSLGTLGVITEVSLKCVPVPVSEQTRVFELSAADAITRCNQWGGRPLPISATCWHDRRLYVRFSGAEPAIASAARKMGGELFASTRVGGAADADEFWASIRDQRHPFFSAPPSDVSLWRLSVRSSAPVDAHGDAQLIEWGGALRWVMAAVDAAESLRDSARSHGGHASCFRGGAAAAGVFQPLSPALATIHQRLKAVFDPAGILNPGRMYAGL